MNMIEMKTAQYTYCVFEIVIVATTPHYDKEQVSDVCHREIKLGIMTSQLGIIIQITQKYGSAIC